MATKRRRTREETPASRPLRRLARADIERQFAAALEGREGVAGAHCIHALWMRNELPMNVERLLEQLWRVTPESVPEWLPMRYVDWLPLVYQVTERFQPEGLGRSNLYLVLLDYEDSPRGPYGVYVGMTQYAPTARVTRAIPGSRPLGPPAAVQESFPRFLSISTRRGSGRRAVC